MRINYMKNMVKNYKGFTLIELLAVITVMAILIMVAIPAVSNVINNSKKKTLANTEATYVKDVKLKLNSHELEFPDEGKSLIVPTSAIELDQGGDSPFTKEKLNGYVKVTNINNKYTYYYVGFDSSGNGIDKWVSEDKLSDSSNIKNNIKKYNDSVKSILDQNNCRTSICTVDGNGEGPVQIKFTINGVVYSVKSGSTFGDWILSSGGGSTGNSVIWVTAAAGVSDEDLKKRKEFQPGGVWYNYRNDTHASGLNLSLYMEIPSHYVNGKTVLPTERFCKFENGQHKYMTYSDVIEENGIYGGDNYLLYNYCCFDAGTKITMADGSIKNIEDIKYGDLVMSYNTSTKKFESNKVTNTIVKHNSDDLVYVTLSDGTKFGMRSYHPFLTNEGYKSLRPEFAEKIMDSDKISGMLSVGDIIIGKKRNSKIISIKTRVPENNIDTYNFTVENNHNYIANGYVVHNAGCPT